MNETIVPSFLVKIPMKFKRPSAKRRRDKEQNPLVQRLGGVWTFNTEAEAIAFAKTFQSCWVEVTHGTKVLWRNYNAHKPVWMSMKKAKRIAEQNKVVRDGQKPNYYEASGENK